MHAVTRGRPHKKKPRGKVNRINKRRALRKQQRAAQRKLKHKLTYLIDRIGYGYYNEVKESPLISANFSYVQRILKQRTRLF